jgi:hypothetical protein
LAQDPNYNPIIPNNFVLLNNIAAKEKLYLGTKNFWPLIQETVITSAQVKALRATPIQIAAAPGSGYVIDLESAVLIAKYGGTNPFTGIQNLAIRYVGAAGVIVSQTITGAGFLDQSTSERTSGLPKVDQIATSAQCDNAGLFLHNTGAAEITGNAAGDNLLIVKCSYNVYSSEF